ncbi:MAG: choice-of-anchor tandem repeat GloVer-containing protein [Bryobacteraceae bacterium]
MIFGLTPSGRETVLYSFPGGPEGAGPAGITLDSVGNVYGATAAGGGSMDEAGYGVVFELTAAGSYSVLYTFAGGADGAAPFSGVIRDSGGNLYGTTAQGGLPGCVAGCGVVYEVQPSGTETVLHSFTGGWDGGNPYAGVVVDPAGNLYGTTPWGGKGGLGSESFSGGGVVFKITP